MAKTSRLSEQFPLRLPQGMRDQIAKAAAESGRSMNAEIIDRLAQTLKKDDPFEKLQAVIDRKTSHLTAHIDEVVRLRVDAYLDQVRNALSVDPATLTPDEVLASLEMIKFLRKRAKSHPPAKAPPPPASEDPAAPEQNASSAPAPAPEAKLKGRPGAGKKPVK